jgi:hypothetical protein
MIGQISLNPWWAEGLMLREGLAVERLIERTAAAGAEGIDMQEAYLGLSPHPDPAVVRRLRSSVAASGLVVTSCWFYADVLGVAGLYSIDVAVAHVERYLAITELFESRFMVIQNGSPPPGMSVAAGKDVLLRFYDRIAPLAPAHGVIVAFEAARGGTPFNSPDGATALVREFGSEWLTVAPDFEAWRLPNASMPSHYAENPELTQADPLELGVLRDCLPWSPFIHVKFLEPQLDGSDPNYPIAELLGIVLEGEREHVLSVEYEGWLPEIHPELDAEAQASLALAAVKRFRETSALAPAS